MAENKFFDKTILNGRSANIRGISLIETMVAIFLLAVMSLAVAQGSIAAQYFDKRMEITNIRRNLAISKTEQLAGVHIAFLDSSYNSNETNITLPGHSIKFSRVTTVVVNADQSRTITVTVNCDSARVCNQPLTYTTRFAKWE